MTINLPIQPYRPLRGGLEAVALELPADVRAETQWRQGLRVSVDYASDDVAASFLWPVECGSIAEIAEAGKPEGDVTLDPYDFHPVVLGGAANCGPNDRSSIGDIAKLKAHKALDRTRWSQIATVLFTGHDGTGPDVNPSFTGTAGAGVSAPVGFDVTNPNGIRETISGMLDSFCNASGAGGDHVFYVPLAYQAYFDAALPGLKWDDARGIWTYGQLDFVFDCFPNVGTATLEGIQTTATDGTEVWIVLGPRPWVGFSDTVEVSARDVLQNKRLVVAEQPAIVAFNPESVTIAKALIA